MGLAGLLVPLAIWFASPGFPPLGHSTVRADTEVAAVPASKASDAWAPSYSTSAWPSRAGRAACCGLRVSEA